MNEKYSFGGVVIVALGGSIIHPDKKINAAFLKEFRKFILKWIGRGKRFVIVAGGGSVARDYQKAANAVISLSYGDKDWIGIHATRLNAHLLRTIFWKEADPVVIDSHSKVSKKMRYPVTIASGWRPGWSTDYIALRLAADCGIKEAIIAGSPAFVYTKDPKKDKSARPIKKLSLKEYRKLIPAKWIPGAHSPVDPIGARLAYGTELKAIIIKGTDLKNFDRLLAGKDFRGTIIE